MLIFLFLLVNSVRLVLCLEFFCSIECECSYENKNAVIVCDREGSSSPRELPDEFRLLDIDLIYNISYNMKNIPLIRANSSLSKKGLQLDYLELVFDKIEIIEPAAFEHTIVRILQLRNNMLSNLDFLANQMNNLEELYLNNNQINHLDQKWFDCLIKLSKLTLSENFIKTIEGGIFTGLGNLVELDLDENQIKTIPFETFSNLTKLVTIGLRKNRIKGIESNAFKHLPSMKCLQLENLFIDSIQPCSFVNLVQLESISLENNRLTSLLKDTFINLSSITQLNLRNNYLSELIKLGEQMPTVQKLNLAENSLFKVDNRIFAGLAKLVDLDLSQNRIEMIESYSFADQRERLQALNLSYNKLGLVKKSHFAELKALLYLDLSFNQISTLEKDSFENTSSLNTLNLDSNCIFFVHKELLLHLQKLELLTMKNNVILVLDRYVFASLSQVVYLMLSSNLIESLPDTIFNSMNKLIWLDLSSNRFKVINSPRLFIGLNSLSYLLLSNNFIQKISFETFSPFRTTLLYLAVDSNSLIDYEFTSNYFFPALIWIDLSSNSKLKNASRLMTELDKCKQCNYAFHFRNMSPIFVQELIQYLKKTPFMVFKITRLDLSHNDLSSLFPLIPFSLMRSRLTWLSLKNTNISWSVSILEKLKYIESIDLSNNKLILSYKYFASETIENMYLSNTGLKDIYNEVRPSKHSENLQQLDLSRNLIDVVKMNDFKSNSYLTHLNLSGNRIFYIEDTSFGPTLYLDLSHNLLSSFSYTLFDESNPGQLVCLFLNNNRLKIFNISYNRYFADLLLQDNFLEEISVNTFFDNLKAERNNISLMQSLKSHLGCEFTQLSLSNNQLNTVEDDIFNTCFGVIKLDLSINKIQNLSTDIFVDLGALEYLNLSSNLIEFIDQKVFKNVKTLVELDLNDNKIKTIMDRSFVNLAHLKRMNIDSLETNLLTDDMLEGLASIKFLNMNSLQFESNQNIRTIIDSLSKKSNSQNEMYTWYSSTYVQFKLSITQMDLRYCSMVLYFAKNNILLNLVTDFELGYFLAVCKSFSFDDLDYQKFFSPS